MTPESQIQTTTLSTMADKVMFLMLDFNRFGNSRQADVEVANTTAEQGRFKHAKTLLESPELKSIQKADNALRLWCLAQPACWKYGKSMYIIGYEAVDVVYEACENYQKVTRPQLVQVFKDVYLSRVAEAQAALGDKFIPSEYPTLEQVTSEFSFTFELTSFSTPENLKKFSPIAYAKEKEKAATKYTLAIEDWKQGRRAILQEMVSHILGILKPEEGKKKKLHATTITKLQGFLDTWNLNSVPDDAEIQGEVQTLKLLMTGVDADKIKESDNLKAELVDKLSSASINLSTLVTTTGRKFR